MPIDRNNAQYITGAIYKPTQTSAPGVWDLDDQANNTAKNLWPLPPSAITRSLRINQSDSAYLNRTFTTAGNRKLWTYSLWAKKNNPTATSTLISARTGNNDDYAFFYWSSTGNLYFLQGRVGANDDIRTSVPIFRDPSAWYHFVIIYDSDNSVGADRIQTYVNGSKVTWSIGTGPMAQGFSNGWVNYNGAHEIGRKTNYQTDYSSDFMIAEVNFIDGQSVAATNFAETDAQTGVWIPKRYTGTYGTNGFRLSFANNSSTTALGYDSSGQGNNWTTNNFSVTPGVNNDVFVDVPSLYNTDTGLGGEVLGNYCTWNPLDKDTNVTLANGNLDLTAYNQGVYATWSLTSGKWYYELTLIDPYNGGGSINFWGYHGLIGVQRSAAGLNVSSFSGIYCNTDTADNNAPGIYQLGTRILAYTTFANSDIIGLAADIDNKTLTIYRNGTVIRSNITLANISTFYIWSGMNGTSGDPGTTSVNFGQRPFNYPAPSEYKALCTTNLPAPAIGQTSSNQADNHFNVVTYTGNGTAQTITGVGFQPDLVWIKNRDAAGENHRWIDSVRGVTKVLYSSLANAEDPNNTDTLTAFTTDGFNIGNNSAVNGNTNRVVAWCWNAGGTTVTNTSGTITSTVRANQRAGFSIVTYTGIGANATVGHGLGVAPNMVICKSRGTAGTNWGVWHSSLTSYAYYLLLNTTAAQATAANAMQALPSSTLLSLGASSIFNDSAAMVAYCFAAVPGYSSFGSYTGNGSADGPFVYLGFRPAFLLFKNISQVYGWQIFDYKRNPNNRVNLGLYPNISNAEGTEAGTGPIDFLSNGFKIRDATWEEINGSTRTYIYAAFAETPARLSTAR